MPLIRFGGWLSTLSKNKSSIKTKSKKYWFGVSEGKVIIVSNLQVEGKKKKIRTKQTERIAQVIKPTSRLMYCDLAILPFNFERMIEEHEIKPVFTKKIL